jgi:plasmid maintenance system killer protein
VDILYQDHKLEKVFGDASLLERKYGKLRAKFIEERLNHFTRAKNLAELRSVPQARCHELKGKRAGTLAVDLGHPYRLIFEPAHDPMPRKPDGGLDWTKVTVISILSVEDYHD